MISDQFKKDYRQMTAQGVEFTPDDVVRLNALAVKIRLSQNAANTVHLPRLAFLGKLVLREPTIAHDLWIEEASRWIDVGDDRNFLWLHGYALSTRAEKLVDAFDPKRLVKKVYRFAAKRLCGFTREQLSAAVEYALFGADWKVGEQGPRTKVEVEKASDVNLNLQPQPLSPTLGLLVNAKAHRLPISLDEAKRMTASELDEAITRCLMNDDAIDVKKARKLALKEYCLAREEIRARGVSAAKTSGTERQGTEPPGK